jgi:hypothetical protein
MNPFHDKRLTEPLSRHCRKSIHITELFVVMVNVDGEVRGQFLMHDDFLSLQR